MIRTLLIVRHAHRNKPFGRKFDNGLSAKGKKQAKNFSAAYRKSFQKKAHLLSSPKLRCVETLKPLSKKTQGKIRIKDSLTEQRETPRPESTAAFKKRVQAFIADWVASEKRLTIACSHGDWIPECARQLLGTPIELKKGGWMELEWDGSKTRLKQIRQKS